MGNKQQSEQKEELDPELLLAYEQNSFLTQNDINELYGKFMKIVREDKRKSQAIPDRKSVTFSHSVHSIEKSRVLELKALKNNPFADYIVDLFACMYDVIQWPTVVNWHHAFS